MKHLRFEDRVSEMRKQDQDKVNELAMGNWKGYSAYKIETASGFSGSLRNHYQGGVISFCGALSYF